MITIFIAAVGVVLLLATIASIILYYVPDKTCKYPWIDKKKYRKWKAKNGFFITAYIGACLTALFLTVFYHISVCSVC